MSLISSIFTFIVTMVLPIGGLLFILEKDRSILKAFLGGVYTYIIFQIVSILPPFKNMSLSLAALGPVAAVAVPAVLLAVISEVVRFFIYKYFLKPPFSTNDGLALGFGHWSIEAVLTTGLTSLSLMTNFSANAAKIDPTGMALSGLERFFVLPILALLSLLCLYTIKSGRYFGLISAIILHCLVNGGTAVFIIIGTPTWMVISLIGILSCACAYVILHLRKTSVFAEK
ncbi:MAG: YhfC family glutamic-type intramembrane protease [Clostridiaceae bacterium]|nr:YhfC family glutamic-type intramembrane protease [Clostridiaceae bacterium]